MNHNQRGACKINNFSSDVTFNNNFIFNNHSKGIQQLTVDYKIENLATASSILRPEQM